MVIDMKDVTFEVTLQMPENSNIQWIAETAARVMEERLAPVKCKCTGFYLLKEEHIGECIV